MESTSPSAAKPSTRERFNALLAEWGPLLVIVYFSIFALVLVGFALAIQFGFDVRGASGTVGTWGAAYVATQLTKPIRIAATFLITPALGALLRRLRRTPEPVAEVVPAGAARPALAERQLDEAP